MSTLCCLHYFSSSHYAFSMLIATLRTLGQFPCASCLVHKGDLHLFGMEENEWNRRVDDPERLYKIRRARKLIFENGKGVESKVVKDILSDQSLIPVNVSFAYRYFLLRLPVTYQTDRTRSHHWPSIISIFSICSFRTSCTSSSLVSGSPY